MQGSRRPAVTEKCAAGAGRSTCRPATTPTAGSPRVVSVAPAPGWEHRHVRQTSRLLVVLWAIGIAAVVAGFLILFGGEGEVTATQVIGGSIGGSFIFCGLIAWQRRPDNRTGQLMTLTGFLFQAVPLVARSHAQRGDRELVAGLARGTRPRVPERPHLGAGRQADHRRVRDRHRARAGDLAALSAGSGDGAAGSGPTPGSLTRSTATRPASTRRWDWRSRSWASRAGSVLRRRCGG